jgi:hypothetical protein
MVRIKYIKVLFTTKDLTCEYSNLENGRTALGLYQNQGTIIDFSSG